MNFVLLYVTEPQRKLVPYGLDNRCPRIGGYPIPQQCKVRMNPNVPHFSRHTPNFIGAYRYLSLYLLRRSANLR